ncbi:MAG: fibrillarin-like rRNA/tRNA 2'-O-methyltransferase [Nanoarchaeota archaeon]
MIQESRLQGIFEEQKGKKRILFTKNLTPGISVCGETLRNQNNVEYREWDPSSSKISAAIIKGLSQLGLKPRDVVLYLGCATGTTVSYVSDIVGDKGLVFAVDIAPRVLRELVFLAQKRSNLVPILADAHHPEIIAESACQVDWLFQDVAQRDQLEIFLKNVRTFLKPGGFGVVAIKARSIDVSKQPRVVLQQIRSQLEKHMTIVDYRELDPFQKDHGLFVAKSASK